MTQPEDGGVGQRRREVEAAAEVAVVAGVVTHDQRARPAQCRRVVGDAIRSVGAAGTEGDSRVVEGGP